MQRREKAQVETNVAIAIEMMAYRLLIPLPGIDDRRRLAAEYAQRQVG